MLRVEPSHTTRVPPPKPHKFASVAPRPVQGDRLRNVTHLAAGIEQAQREIVVFAGRKARPGTKALVIAADLEQDAPRQGDVRTRDHLARLAATEDFGLGFEHERTGRLSKPGALGRRR